MGIKATAYNPTPHTHALTDVTGIDTALYGAAGRTQAPVCDFVYSGTFGIGNASDTSAGGGFSSLVDTAGMWFGAGGGGAGDTTKARVLIPFTGRYEVDWQWFVDGVGTSVCSATVTMNGTSVTSNSIAAAQGAGNGWAGPHARVSRVFNANDLLYFWMWQGSGATRTVYGTWFGGVRTRGTIRWVGPA